MDLYYAIDDDNSGTVDINEFRNNLWVRRRKALKNLSRMDMSFPGRLKRYAIETFVDIKDSVHEQVKPVLKLMKKEGTSSSFEKHK